MSDHALRASMAQLFDEWMTDPASLDPFRARIQRMRAEAAFFREVWHDEQKAHWLEQQAGAWEDLFSLARDLRVSYEEAAAIGIYEHGTIKNKVSAGELEGGNGKIALRGIPICPAKAPDLHAFTAVDRLRGMHEEDMRSARTKTKAGGVMDRVAKARKRRAA